ncbi:hypothetical protein [Sinomicrobium soli]|uniref:hypothetical protein n=1 Tax=Sinomicrobium sp. N-1-3-6 TaxID=2219864 RepID=UPI000DCC85C3|nr:hypothetical protein [Sinomicrobium sp. N-1-3-6]RAV29425.1 hypothetical protein DN748_07940 [Sinomicrobium sp. N-1-3-6]
MKRLFFAFFKTLLAFTAVLFGVQYAVMNYGAASGNFHISPFAIYGFHFLSTLLIYALLLYVSRTARDRTGHAFMAGSVVRMLASVVFLWPLMEKDADPVADILAFFIPYFVFLTIEVFYVVKLLQEDEK